jgi:hypothetical protein
MGCGERRTRRNVDGARRRAVRSRCHERREEDSERWQDKRIRVWDVETHELIEEWESHTQSGIYCIAMSPDDQLAASGGNNGEIVIREIEEGGRIKHAINAGHTVRG